MSCLCPVFPLGFVGALPHFWPHVTALKELIGPKKREAPNKVYLDFSYAIEEF
jgi:hypothetical protein